VVRVETEVPKVAGQSIAKRWKARVTDPRAFVTAVLAWPDWQSYIAVNQGEADRLAARTKGAVSVPGVDFYSEATLSSRGM